MAASKTIGGINVTISATVDKFTKGIITARKALGKLGTSIKDAVFSVKGFAAALAGGVAVTAFTRLTANAFEAIDAMGELSDKLGISTDKLAGLQLAASEAGISNELLERSLVKLSREMGMSGDLALRKWIEDTSKLSTQQEKLAAAVKMFGARGSDMVRFLNGGTGALDEAQAAAEGLGLALDRKTVAGVERAMDAFGRFKMAVGGIFKTIAADLAPFIEVLANKMTGFLADGGKAKSIGSAVANAVIDTAKFVADAIQQMVGGVMMLVADIKKFIVGFRTSATGIGLGMGYKDDKELDAASTSAYESWYAADRFSSSPAWSTIIEKAVADARAAAAAQAASNPSLSGGSIGGVFGSLKDRLMNSGAVVNAQQMGGALMNGLKNAKGAIAGLPGMAAAVGANTRSNLIEQAKKDRDAAMSGSLTLNEAGSAESYRQRAAMRRQAEGEKIWKQQLAALLKIADNTKDGMGLAIAR